MNKKEIALLVTYLLGALLTNSYCRNCRWDDWDKDDDPNWRAMNPQAPFDPDPALSTASATILWPVYVAARTADAVVNCATKIEVEWK